MSWQLVAMLIEPYFPIVVLVMVVLQIVSLLLFFHSKSEIRRIQARIKRLAEIGEGNDLTTILERFQDLKSIQRAIDILQEKVNDLGVCFEGSLSRIGLVRFNAFPDTGSDLSFALAILTHEGNGFILTSLYARDETRVFIKPVNAGRSTYKLSEEEEKALAISLGLETGENKRK